MFAQIQKKLIKNCGVKFDDITKAKVHDDTSNYAPLAVSIGFGEDIKERYDHLCTGIIIAGWNNYMETNIHPLVSLF